MNPRDGEHARRWIHGTAHGVDDRIGRRGRCVLVHLDSLHAASCPIGADRYRGFSRVVLVRRRHNLVAWRQPEAGVQQAQPHGGAIGQRDVGRQHAEIARCGLQHLAFQAPALVADVAGGIALQLPAMPGDGLADRARVRRKQKPGHVNAVGSQLEEAVEPLPMRRSNRSRSQRRPSSRLLRPAPAIRTSPQSLRPWRSGSAGDWLMACPHLYRGAG